MDTINKIMMLLEQNNLSQKELTDYLKLDKSTFSAWKNGKSKSFYKYLSQIADFLNVSTDYLLANNMDTPHDQLNNVYLSLAKEAQNEGIDPQDIKLAIETIKAMRNK